MAIRTSGQWIAGHPRLVAQWHRSRNVGVYPYEVSRGSTRRIWWRCDRGPDHEWSAAASSRVGGAGCPFCANQRVSVTNSLAVLHPALAREWCAERNGKLRPTDVVAGSTRVAWWKCEVAPDHLWQAQ